MTMLIGINGISKSGKDALADMLEPFKSVKIACADEMKRICRQVYPEMTINHLWGPSEMRNEPLKAYPRENHVFINDGEILLTCACCGAANEVSPPDGCYLTPRYALQLLGAEWGRFCHKDTWINIVLKNSHSVLRNGYAYQKTDGIVYATNQGYQIVTVPDLRYRNEMEAIRKAGGKLWRIKRDKAGLKGGMAKHTSETEQLEVPDEYFDLIFDNNSSLEALQMHLEFVMKGA